MTEDSNQKKTELEIEKLKIETRQLKWNWLQPNFILNFLVFVVALISGIFLSRITDIKSERLLLQKENLKYEIAIFKQEKNIINDSLSLMRIKTMKYNDSLSTLNKLTNDLYEQLKDKEIRINNLISKLSNYEDSVQYLEEIKKEIKNISTFSAMSFINYEMYPNPAENHFYIVPSFQSKFIKLGVSILDPSGNEIFNKTFNAEKKIKVDLDQNLQGIYFVRITNFDSGSMNVKKLIVK